MLFAPPPRRIVAASSAVIAPEEGQQSEDLKEMFEDVTISKADEVFMDSMADEPGSWVEAASIPKDLEELNAKFSRQEEDNDVESADGFDAVCGDGYGSRPGENPTA